MDRHEGEEEQLQEIEQKLQELERLEGAVAAQAGEVAEAHLAAARELEAQGRGEAAREERALALGDLGVEKGALEQEKGSLDREKQVEHDLEGACQTNSQAMEQRRGYLRAHIAEIRTAYVEIMAAVQRSNGIDPRIVASFVPRYADLDRKLAEPLDDDQEASKMVDRLGAFAREVQSFHVPTVAAVWSRFGAALTQFL